MDYSVLELGEHVLIGTYMAGDVEDGEVVEVLLRRTKSENFDRDVYTIYTRDVEGVLKVLGFRYVNVDGVMLALGNHLGYLNTFRLVE